MAEVQIHVPRRCRLDLMVPAETAITDAIEEVELMSAHPLLTEAIILLQQAREKVADYVDLPHPSDVAEPSQIV